MTAESKRPRLLFLDTIKVLFSILVIFNHARVTYEGSGWWYYIESNPVDPFSSIVFLVIIGIGMISVLIPVFYARFNQQGNLLRNLSAQVYRYPSFLWAKGQP